MVEAIKQPLFLYMDLDAFFASVEIHSNPVLKGLPVVIAGTGEHAVVSTASYEARKLGVHSGMSLLVAKKLSPNLIFLPVNLDKYCKVSRAIMSTLSDISPVVVQRSIDEAYLDICGLEGLWGTPIDIINLVKKKVKEVSGVTCSCGVASSPYIAKIASDFHKPDGFTIIESGGEQDFILSLPLKKLYGVGGATLSRLESSGIATTQDLYNKSFEFLRLLFGDALGRFLYNAVRGEDKSFSTPALNHSLSSECTMDTDLYEISSCRDLITQLSQEVAERLLSEDLAGNLITVKIRYSDFSTVTASKTYDDYITSSFDLYEKALSLFNEKVKISQGVRLLGIAVAGVRPRSECVSQYLFEDEKEKKFRALDRVIMKVNRKYGKLTLRRGTCLGRDTGDGDKARPKHKKKEENHDFN